LNTFEELGLSSQALASLAEVGFTEPTEIQSKAIGIVGQRKDLIASAQTGSGKTVAYALPILDMIRADAEERSARAKTRALIIVPTRELALQVRDEFERFGASSGIKAVTLYGGTGYSKQIRALHRGADVIVATPGRLLDCLNKNYATLSRLQVLVLDEADRLLDMGFMPQVRAVVAKAPAQRQTLMFSATIDARMKKIAEEFLQAPEVVSANHRKIEPSSINQQWHFLKETEKEKKLMELLVGAEDGSALVFTKTRAKATILADRLRQLGVLAEEIHGDITQSQRVRTLNRFKAGEFNVLVATDVAARGLDVPAISHVFNYDLPMLAEDYVHRIGRTGRAGRSGVAHSFVSRDQKHLVNEIHKVLKNDGNAANAGRELNPAFQRSVREAEEFVERIASGGQPRTPGAQRRSPGGQRHTHGGQRQPHGGSRQAFAGKREAYGEKRETYGGKREAYGEKREAYGEKRETYGGKREAYGEKRETYGGKREAYGEKRETYGGKREAYGEKRESYGGKREAYGEKRETYGGKREAYGDKRETYSGKREAYGDKRETYGGKREAYGDKRETYGGKREAHGGFKRNESSTSKFERPAAGKTHKSIKKKSNSLHAGFKRKSKVAAKRRFK
jgi:ATP-dependent RNA helicase RhlE